MNRKFHLMAVVSAVLGLAATFTLASGAVPVSALSEELASSIDVSVDHPLVRSGEQLTVNVSLGEATDTVSVLQVNVQDPQEALQVSTPGEQTVTIPPGATSTSIVLRTRANPPADQVPEISISVGNAQLLPSATFTVSVLGSSVLRDFAIVVETETVLLDNATEVVAARDELLVHLWHDATLSEYDAVLDYIRSQDLEIVAFHRDLSALQIRIPSGASEAELERDLNGLPGVLSAGPNQIVELSQSTPLVPASGGYWIGDINLARAWELEDQFSRGNSDVNVAVVDDFLGFPGPPDEAHGRYVEGFVRAVSRYSDVHQFQVNGVFDGGAPRSNLLSALSNAINSGAKVVNFSWGPIVDPDSSASDKREIYQDFRLAMLNAITAAQNNDVLVVQSAGNDHLKEDNELFPGARFESDLDRLLSAEQRWRSNVVNVGASTKYNRDALFSVAGATVDLFAPGERVSYGVGASTIEGTSFSAPQVAGAAAVVSNIALHLSAPQLKAIIIDSADSNVLTGPTCPFAPDSFELLPFFRECFIGSDRPHITDPLLPLQNNRRLNLGAAAAIATVVTGTNNPLPGLTPVASVGFAGGLNITALEGQTVTLKVELAGGVIATRTVMVTVDYSGERVSEELVISSGTSSTLLKLAAPDDNVLGTTPSALTVMLISPVGAMLTPEAATVRIRMTDNELQLSGTGMAVLSRRDETQSWNFTLAERTFVNVQSRSSIDLSGRLLNSQGDELARSDGFLNQRDFRIERWLDAGIYTVEVELRSGGNLLDSPYEILVDELTVAGELTDGVPVTVDVPASERSLPIYYQLEMPERLLGAEIAIESMGDHDTVARLLNSEGIPVAEDDDGGGFDSNFRIAHALGPGVYYISVQPYISGPSGNRGYSPLEGLGIVFRGRKLESGGTGMETFLSSGAIHRWTLALATRTFVNVQSRSGIDLSGRLLNSQGHELSQSDGFLNQRDFRMERWLDAGTYTVETRLRSDDSLGSPYEILADEVMVAGELQYNGSAITEDLRASERSLPTYYQLEVPERLRGVEVVIESTGDNEPAARLLNGEGVLIEENGRGGRGGNFRIVRALEPGTYYISVQPFTSGSSGNRGYGPLDGFGIVFRERTADDAGQSLELGGTGTGTFFTRNEVHRWTLALVTRTFVNVQSRSGIDLRGTLLNSQGDELAQSDGFLNQRDFRIERWLDAGTYIVEARVRSGGSLGRPYEILADEVVADELVGNAFVIIDVPASRRSLPAYYRIEVPERLRDVKVTIESIGDNDPAVRLLNGEGMLVEENDDGEVGRNFHIRRVLEPGIYYIGVQPFVEESSGNRNYPPLEDLGIAFFGRAAGDEIGGPLELGGSKTEEFSFPDEVHRWTLALTTRTFVNVQSRSGIDLISRLLNSQGDELAQSDDFLDQLDFRIERWLDAGTYTVEVRFFSDDSSGGLYKILADAVVVAGELTYNVPVIIDVPASRRSLPTYYRIEVPERLRGVKIVIESTGDNDTMARLLNSEGVPVTDDDDDGRDLNFHIARVLEPGIYYIGVQPFIEAFSGNLSYGPLEDLRIVFFGVTDEPGGPLELGETGEGAFLARDGVHRWTLTLTTRTFVNVQTRLNVQNPINTGLKGRLLNSRGNELAQLTTFLNQRNFRIERWLDAGIYTIELRLISGNALGRPYEILADEVVVAGQLAYNDPAMIIKVPSSERSLPAYYQLEIPERRRVVIESTGDNDPIARLLDSEGLPVAENDQGGGGDNFRIVRTLNAGTYYIGVQPFIFPDQHNVGYRALSDLGVVFREPTPAEAASDDALGSVGFLRLPVSPVEEGASVELRLVYYNPAGFVSAPPGPLRVLVNFSDGRSPRRQTEVSFAIGGGGLFSSNGRRRRRLGACPAGIDAYRPCRRQPCS